MKRKNITIKQKQLERLDRYSMDKLLERLSLKEHPKLNGLDKLLINFNTIMDTLPTYIVSKLPQSEYLTLQTKQMRSKCNTLSNTYHTLIKYYGRKYIKDLIEQRRY